VRRVEKQLFGIVDLRRLHWYAWFARWLQKRGETQTPQFTWWLQGLCAFSQGHPDEVVLSARRGVVGKHDVVNLYPERCRFRMLSCRHQGDVSRQCPTGTERGFCAVRVLQTVLARCYSPRVRGGRCCFGRTRPSLIECSLVVMVPVCWLCAFPSVSVCASLVAFGSLGSFPFLVKPCACFLCPSRFSICCCRQRMSNGNWVLLTLCLC
jgi:hypothetical protein